MAPAQEEPTTVEALPQAATTKVRRMIGKMGGEDTVTISAPAPFKKGTRSLPRGTAGLRAPPPQKQEGTVSAVSSEMRDKVQANRESRRQQVWDKLDAAKKRADERAPRLMRFVPVRMADDDEPKKDPQT